MLEYPVDIVVLPTRRKFSEEGGSDNLRRTDNQQERSSMFNVKAIPSHIGWYFAGFSDGEGNFSVSFRPEGGSFPWRVGLCFNVSQRDEVILSLFKRHLECGTMRQRRDGVWYFEVNNLEAITGNVIPFFRRFCFLSAKKKRDFAKFVELADIMKNRRHLTVEGINEVLAVRSDMNDGGKRRYDDEAILNRIRDWKSSETVRQTIS